MYSKTIIAALVAACAAGADAAAVNQSHDNKHAPTALTLSGLVRGGYCPNSKTKHFQGIPYAEAPVGKLRFMPPQRYRGFFPIEGYDATKTPASCVQFPSPYDADGPTSEDCLFLDVHVPATARPFSGLPVKVWAHGGGNDGGSVSYPLYDACNSADDAIIVNFNYRLGSLGFLALQDAGIEGNMALKDYVMALEWVKLNIASFGGDPFKIMLFGQSSGADDTFTVSTLPQIKGLIHSAVAESGGGEDVPPISVGNKAGAAYAKTLGCSPSDLHCLQSKTAKELKDAFDNTELLNQRPVIASVFGIPLLNIPSIDGPVVDGKFLKKQPLAVGSQVPIIAGSTGDDGSLIALPYLFSLGTLTEKTYTDLLSAFGPVADMVEKQYPLSNFNFTGNTSEAVAIALTHITTVAAGTCASNKILRSTIANGNAAYAYRFDLVPTCPILTHDGEPFPTGPSREIFGALHTAEIPFIFNNLDHLPFGQGNCSLSAPEREVSKTLKGAWTAMAAHANPSTHRQNWSKLTHENKGLHITKDNKTVFEKLDFDECPFWDAVFEKLGGVHVP